SGRIRRSARSHAALATPASQPSAARSRALSASLRARTGLALKHRSERTGIEVRPQLRDLPVPDRRPLGDRRGADGARLQVVDRDHVLAVPEHLLDVDTLDDRCELRQRLQVVVRVVERLERPLEVEVVGEQRARCLHVAAAKRLLVAPYYFQCFSHKTTMPDARGAAHAPATEIVVRSSGLVAGAPVATSAFL